MVEILIVLFSGRSSRGVSSVRDELKAMENLMEIIQNYFKYREKNEF